MIKLSEILHTISSEKESGYTPVDNWKITDAEHLQDMGFTADGQYHFSLKNPNITVAHKKGEGFVLEDLTKKQKHTFPKFKDLINHFEKYEQQWERTPYL